MQLKLNGKLWMKIYIVRLNISKHLDVLYNDTERRRRDLDVATEINDKEIKKDWTFQPQICDNNSAHSKFKLELAKYFLKLKILI